MRAILRFNLMLAVALLATTTYSAENVTSCTRWPEAIFLLRHAEKQNDSSDSPLSSTGWQRAGGLPQALSEVEVGAILVSDKQRTRQTAMALEAYTGITSKAFGSNDLKKLVGAVCAVGESGGKSVVVVGHTSTIPEVMKEIGLDGLTPEFGDLYVVNTATWNVDQRRYGDCSEGGSEFRKVTKQE